MVALQQKRALSSRSGSKRPKGVTLIAFFTCIAVILILWLFAQYQYVVLWLAHQQNAEQQQAATPSSSSSKVIDFRISNYYSSCHGKCVCFTWDEEDKANTFWLEHPDYDIAYENLEQSCFTPIADPERADFLRQVYQLQWHSNCSKDVQTHQINNGFGASLGVQAEVFLKVFQRGLPYQMTKHWEGMHWLYVPHDNTSWAWCPSTDFHCYFLPISNCPPVWGRHDRVPNRERIHNATQLLWIQWYLARPLHKVRRRVVELLHNRFPAPISLPCTTMHVRRSDAGFAQRPFRRYAALSEYLQAANVGKGEAVVLLTDDVSTIQEAQQFHPDIQWLYVPRPRPNGTSGKHDDHRDDEEDASNS